MYFLLNLHTFQFDTLLDNPFIIFKLEYFCSLEYWLSPNTSHDPDGSIRHSYWSCICSCCFKFSYFVPWFLNEIIGITVFCLRPSAPFWPSSCPNTFNISITFKWSFWMFYTFDIGFNSSSTYNILSKNESKMC